MAQIGTLSIHLYACAIPSVSAWRRWSNMTPVLSKYLIWLFNFSSNPLWTLTLMAYFVWVIVGKVDVLICDGYTFTLHTHPFQYSTSFRMVSHLNLYLTLSCVKYMIDQTKVILFFFFPSSPTLSSTLFSSSTSTSPLLYYLTLLSFSLMTLSTDCMNCRVECSSTSPSLRDIWFNDITSKDRLDIVFNRFLDNANANYPLAAFFILMTSSV